VVHDGYYGDAAITVPVGEKLTAELKKLLEVTEASLYKGIEQVKIGNTVGHVGSAIQKHVEANGFSVVREFVGMVSDQAARSAADSKLWQEGPRRGVDRRHGLGDRADGQRGRS